MVARRIIMGTLVLLVCLGLSGRLSASEKGHSEESDQSEDAEKKIPETLGGIWHEVREHEEELGKIIADKKFDKVHEAAFEIRDLVNAMPDKSTDLPADKLAKVKSNAKYVADIAKRLDESGDAGDQVVTEANFKKLQGFLKTIEAQYPPEILAMPKVKMYVCPMDGYASDKPGKCPVCGMNLKEKEMAAAEGEAADEKEDHEDKEHSSHKEGHH